MWYISSMPTLAASRLSLLLPALASVSGVAAPPFFPPTELMQVGVYYYPEHWPRAQWERDLKRMGELGFTFTHFAEFAWAQLEPTEGRFDFRWLDEALALADKAGLKVILCTPAYCPPAWLSAKHPEIYLVDAQGQRRKHGLRGEASLASPVYQRYVTRIVEALAQRYGKDPRVMGWQVDNEPLAAEDFSPAARKAFQGWLKTRYGTVEKLNTAWGATFWSFVYGSFDQVVIPNGAMYGEDKLSPHAVLDWKRFVADQQAAHLDRQARILKRHARPGQWLTTNYTNVSAASDARRTKDLDFATFTMYPVAGANILGGQSFRYGNPNRMAEACDFHRPIGGATGVMELQPGQVNWAAVNPLPAPGAIRMWMWHAFGGGSSFVCTYRYRHPLFGSELYHDGIVGTDGQTLTQGGQEFVQVIQELKRLQPEGTPEAPLPTALAARRTGFLWSHDGAWDLENLKETAHWNTWRHRGVAYSAVKSTAAPVDFVDEKADFKAYPFLVAPAYQLLDESLVAKWKAYVEAGGHLVLTCRTGQKDRNGQFPEGPWAGRIAELIGADIQGFDVLPSGVEGTVKRGEQSHRWSVWGDLITPRAGTEVLASYGDQFYAGKAAAVRRTLGKGSVTYIGVETADQALERSLVREVYTRAGVAIEDLPRGAYLEWRKGLWVGVNYTNAPVAFPLPLSAQPLLGASPLKPADVLVWKDSERR